MTDDLARKMYLAETAVVRDHLADQTTPLRDRIAAALYERERPPREPAWVDAYPVDREVFEAMADAVLPAVLSMLADRGAILRDAANALAVLGPVDSLVSGPKAWAEAVETLRRMADETATTETGRGCPSDCPCRAVCIGPLKPAAEARQDGARP